MREAVIVNAVRSPIGKFLGKLSSYSAVELGAHVLRELMARTKLDPATIEAPAAQATETGDVDIVMAAAAVVISAKKARSLGLTPMAFVRAQASSVSCGAVALGHPIGASGCRVLTTLLYALRWRNLTRGVAALCIGAGNSVELAVERVA